MLDTQTEFGYTALHWCAAYGGDDADGVYAAVAKELVNAGADTSLCNTRGQTPWELAEACGSTTVLDVFSFFASSSAVGCPAFRLLKQEKEKRDRMPEAKLTFRDDIKIDSARLDFWSIKPFEEWKLISEGAYGKVFDIPAAPDIEVAGRRFRRIAVKVPKPEGVQELTDEVKSLSHLCHRNVVQILGMSFGKTKGGDDTHWMMMLEFADSTLTALLYDPAQADPDGMYAQPKEMCELVEQIVAGLVYIHGEGVQHLDIKPDNILLARDPAAAGKYVAKLADFGMQYQDDELTAKTQSSSECAQLQRTASPSASGGDAAVPDDDAIVPFGTWEYLSPECWKRKYGKPSTASDIFSLGLMMWEMLARSRISAHLLDESNPGHVEEDGKALNVEVVPVLLIKGERPRFTGLQEQCGWHVYYRLMQACWVADMAKRPTAALVAEALRLAKSYVRSEQTEQEIAALKAEERTPAGAPSADTRNGEAAVTYDDFLAVVGVQDKKAELAEYLTAGAELEELKQYDEEELDEDILDGLGLDEASKTSFHEELRTLQQLPAADEPAADDKEGSQFDDPAVVAAAAQAAAEREAQWPKWPTLQQMLPGLPGLETRGLETQTLEEALRRLRAKDEELAATVAAKDAELAATVAAKDEELAATVAAKDGELELLRAQLARFEGVQPQWRTADPQ